MGKRTTFLTHCFALNICQHPDGRFLAIKETQERGWWIPGGGVDAGETFQQAAVREALEEAGIHIELKGVLRVEHKVRDETMRIKVIFYAVPSDPNAIPKQISDQESDRAQWVTLEEAGKLHPWRGDELQQWARYLQCPILTYPIQQGGGKPYPLSILAMEGSPVPYPSPSL